MIFYPVFLNLIILVMIILFISEISIYLLGAFVIICSGKNILLKHFKNAYYFHLHFDLNSVFLKRLIFSNDLLLTKFFRG